MNNNLYYIWKKGEKIQLSEHFTTKEFECKCSYVDCVEQRIKKSHVEKLEEKRKKWDCAVKVTSGFRCFKHNKDIGGEDNSFHMKGDATDIVVQKVTPNDVQDDCEDFQGLGRYVSFTHVDSREGKKARWDFRNK